jgi:fumarate hydratase subunit alpha
VMLKGGGSDNASALTMLPPSAGLAGVREFLLATVATGATGACPPLVIGLAVGGTFDSVAGLAKRALLRAVGSPAANDVAAGIEAELLAAVNATGIGPAGLGGRTTALAVHLATAPCHIAALPVAVNLGCNAIRSASVEVQA